MKYSLLLPVVMSLPVLAGCATMFTGNHQDLQVRTHSDIVDQRLDHVVTFNVISDRGHARHENVAPGETFSVHRTGVPVSVQIQESQCILPTEERFESGVHPAVTLDFLATSLLSTSIDSSTGALWKYDSTLVVTPKVKDTPECVKWLNDEVAKMDDHVITKRAQAVEQLDRNGKYPVDANAVLRPRGYAEQFEK